MSYIVRMFLLRNCGRFVSIASDFGSNYKTQNFVSSEALYAGLTREQTRKQPKFVDIENDQYDFFKTFDVDKLSIWFTPGVFVERDNPAKLQRKARRNSDINQFNVLDEDYPRTGTGRDYQKQERFYRGNRPHYCPTYGSIESILPDNLLRTFAISEDKKLLEQYGKGQTFLLGKKRTMFQVQDFSEIMGAIEVESGEIVPTQIQFADLNDFSASNILAATARYILALGNYTKIILSASCQKTTFGFPKKMLPF